MATRFLSHRQLAQDPGRALQAADEGPVFITNQGRLSCVLLSIQDYERLTSDAVSVVDALAMPAEQNVEFEPPRMELQLKP